MVAHGDIGRAGCDHREAEGTAAEVKDPADYRISYPCPNARHPLVSILENLSAEERWKGRQ